nr:alpha/beta fold hydrolase [Thetidibacter halocola]
MLIHGASHGAWAWRDVIPALEALGHEAHAIDLPSHGDDVTPLADVTLDLYAQAVLDALDGPSVVVGHSMGGYPITRAAQIDASNVARLVYLCAYVPRPGLSLAEMRRQADTQPLLEAIRRNPDGLSMHFDPDMAEAKFYHDCAEVLDYAVPRLCDQALAPMETALPEGAVDVPRSFVVGEDDRAIPPDFQRRMAADLPEADRHALPSSHSPFFSMPGRLAALLDAIARG